MLELKDETELVYKLQQGEFHDSHLLSAAGVDSLVVPLSCHIDLSSSTRVAEQAKTIITHNTHQQTIMKISASLTQEFQLARPLSPFMFINEPTLNGVVKVTMPCCFHQTITLGVEF